LNQIEKFVSIEGLLKGNAVEKAWVIIRCLDLTRIKALKAWEFKNGTNDEIL
jgi:hypothetical protein